MFSLVRAAELSYCFPHKVPADARHEATHPQMCRMSCFGISGELPVILGLLASVFAYVGVNDATMLPGLTEYLTGPRSVVAGHGCRMWPGDPFILHPWKFEQRTFSELGG